MEGNVPLLSALSSQNVKVNIKLFYQSATSVLLLHAQLSLQGLPQLPLSDKLHFQLRPLQLVLLLLRSGVLYGNPQQTLLGDNTGRDRQVNLLSKIQENKFLRCSNFITWNQF